MASTPSSLDVPKDEQQPVSSASTVAAEPSFIEKIDDTSARDSESITKDEDAGSANDAGEPDDIEYPTGAKMFFIVVALVMSIFLLSLDQVH